MKRLQNRISESGLLLPVVAVYGLLVWVAAGLLSQNLWPQLVCFALSAYMMVELNDMFSLLRVRSRMISSVFIVLSCTMSFLFASFSGAMVQLFSIAMLLLLLSTYQSPQSVGRIFYAFLLLGLSTLFSVQMVLLVPLLWLLMATHLQSLSVRGLLASLIGLLTPYWFISVWFVHQRDFSPLAGHFSALAAIVPLSEAYASLTVGHLLACLFVAGLTLAGMANFWRQRFNEKIRTRMFYGLLAWLSLSCMVLTALQPQHYDPLMRFAVVCACPPVAHFLTLTSSRITNIAFFVIALLAVALAVYNVV